MGDEASGERGSGQEPGVGASLRSFSLRVLVGTLLAVGAAVAAMRWWGSGEKPALAPAPAATPGVMTPSPPAGERAGERRQRPVAPVSPTAREVERRLAAGALSAAQKRFARCPGGDVRRLAWIDGGQVVKLLRERDDGVVLEEWFDGEGRLREARWSGRGANGTWGGRLTVDAEGHEAAEELAGEGRPDAPPPSLDRRDPTGAFFADPSCGR